MTLAQIRERAKSRIPDTTFWTDAKLTGMVNDAINDTLKFFNITRVKSHTTFTTVADQQRYELPWDWVETHMLWLGDGHRYGLYVVDDPEKVYKRVSDPTTSGVPTTAYFWSIDSRVELWLYPIPNDEYTIEHFFWSQGSYLVNDDDVPMIAQPYHQSLVDYLQHRIRSEDADSLQADAWFINWWRGELVAMRVSNNRKTNERRDMSMPNASSMFWGGDNLVENSFRLGGSTYRW